MSFGLSENGFNLMRLPDIMEELQADLREEFGKDINLEADSAFGQLAGVIGQVAADVWELMGEAWHAQYRAWADGEHLDAMGTLVAMPRRTDETDLTYRERLRLLPSSGGNSTADTLRASLLAVEGVRSVTVLTPDDTPDPENDNAYTVPDYRFEVVADIPDDATVKEAVARAIWAHKPAGVRPYSAGDSTTRVEVEIEEEGTSYDAAERRVIAFSRPREKHLMIFAVLGDPPGGTGLPFDWKEQVKKNLLAFGNGHGIGESLVAQRFFEPVFQVAGIRNIRLIFQTSPSTEQTSELLWDSQSPSAGAAQEGVIQIAAGELAVFQANDVLVSAG